MGHLDGLVTTARIMTKNAHAACRVMPPKKGEVLDLDLSDTIDTRLPRVSVMMENGHIILQRSFLSWSSSESKSVDRVIE
jgi:hypothetical protein